MQQEAHREASSTAARRKRAYQQGLEQGLAQGLKQGLAEAQEIAYQKGFEAGKKLACATSQSTNEALSKRACELQLQLAETARSEFKATATAVDFVVKCQQRDNRIAELERALGNEAQRSEELGRIVTHQASELEAVRKFQSSSQTSLASSAHLSTAAPATRRAGSSPYLNHRQQTCPSQHIYASLP